MADELQVIQSLVSVLQFYADPDFQWTQDMNLDEASPYFLKPGERARAAVKEAIEVTSTFRPHTVNFESCDVSIRQLSNPINCVEIKIDGVVQERVTRLCLDIDAMHGSMIRVDRAINCKMSKSK